MVFVVLMIGSTGCSKPHNPEAPNTAPAMQEEGKKDAGKAQDGKGAGDLKIDPEAADFFKKADDF